MLNSFKVSKRFWRQLPKESLLDDVCPRRSGASFNGANFNGASFRNRTIAVSSNHRPLPHPAVVLELGVPVGGISLPADNPEAFFVEFQRQYGTVGLSLYRIVGLDDGSVSHGQKVVESDQLLGGISEEIERGEG